jgi:hypothetical protein
MRFTLEIELGNAEMQTPDHVAEALNRTADKLWNTGWAHNPREEGGSVRDLNGNRVGSWEVLP